MFLGYAAFPAAAGFVIANISPVLRTKKSNPLKEVLVLLVGERSFMWRLVGTSEFGQCKTQTMDCRLNTECKMHTADIVTTESCFIES